MLTLLPSLLPPPFLRCPPRGREGEGGGQAALSAGGTDIHNYGHVGNSAASRRNNVAKEGDEMQEERHEAHGVFFSQDYLPQNKFCFVFLIFFSLLSQYGNII